VANHSDADVHLCPSALPSLESPSGAQPASGRIVDLLDTYYGVDVQPLDFAGDPGASRGTINDWIEDQTQGLIRDLLPDGFIQPMTVLVLTNTLYLKPW
jgi:serine protease inhibitor